MPYRPYPNADRALRHVTRQREASAWHPDVVFNPATNEFTEWARFVRSIGNNLERAGAAALIQLAGASPTVRP
ncbi:MULTISPECIES: hypothetical protein [unclassified Streptomyces]|uniref:hypothetical protein n=1 Tax=unclassified Streptomyces TaxID=2593676 RepID=UPI00332E8440